MIQLNPKNDLMLPTMTTQEKPQHKIKPPSIIEIHKDPPMQRALDLISLLGQYREIILIAKGNAISNAVTVSNIITKSILKGSSEIDKVDVDSEFTGDMGQLQSIIEIKIIIKNLQ